MRPATNHAAGIDSTTLDSSYHYPQAYELTNVLVVGALHGTDEMAPFSNRGAKNVDVTAPGVGIWSTTPTVDTPLMKERRSRSGG